MAVATRDDVVARMNSLGLFGLLDVDFILEEVFELLDPQDLLRMSLVSRFMNVLAEEESLVCIPV